MKYVIRKKWRSGPGGYTGPCCAKAGVTPGRTYDTRDAADADCAKLNAVSPMFEVVAE